jgi:branched-subunit amino acid transport protein AzlD
MDKMAMFLFPLTIILATQSTRLLPLLFEKRMGAFYEGNDFRKKVNFVIFSFLTCYCFRDFSLTEEYGLRIFSAIVVMILQYRFEKTLLSIFFGTFLYMFILSRIN